MHQELLDIEMEDNWYNEQGVQISDPTLLAEATLKEKFLHY